MQAILSILTVSAAVFYLGYKGYQAFFAKKSTCEGCAFSKSSQANQVK